MPKNLGTAGRICATICSALVQYILVQIYPSVPSTSPPIGPDPTIFDVAIRHQLWFTIDAFGFSSGQARLLQIHLDDEQRRRAAIAQAVVDSVSGETKQDLPCARYGF